MLVSDLDVKSSFQSGTRSKKRLVKYSSADAQAAYDAADRAVAKADRHIEGVKQKLVKMHQLHQLSTGSNTEADSQNKRKQRLLHLLLILKSVGAGRYRDVPPNMPAR